MFKAPMNADSILEMVEEAFTYDGGNLMRNGMEEVYDAARIQFVAEGIGRSS